MTDSRIPAGVIACGSDGRIDRLPAEDIAEIEAFEAFLTDTKERLPMKVYLAARYSRRLELCEYRTQLGQMGIEVTSRWLNGKHQIDDQGVPIGDDGEKWVEDEGSGTAPARLRTHFAQEDVADVLAADGLIAFTEVPRTSTSRGGRHVEFGIAIGTGKWIVVIGPRENVFTWLPQVEQHESWQDFLSYEFDRFVGLAVGE
jgi:hypothetical protein